MTEPSGVPEYVPGDRIRFTLSFTHKMNLKGIEARLVFQGEERSNFPMIAMVPVRNGWQTYVEGAYRRSIVELQSLEKLGSNIYPGGEYKLDSVGVKTISGKVLGLSGIPYVRCRVCRVEPSEEPVFEGFEWS
jgi:hypothetical protein